MSERNPLVFGSVVAVVVLAASIAGGQQPRTDLVSSVRVTIKSTPGEQMRAATEAWQSIGRAKTDQERFDAFTASVLNLEIVPVKWPSDTEAVLQSAIMYADINMQWHIPSKAAMALESVKKRSAGGPLECAIELRLAQARELQGDDAEAERHYRAAVASIRPTTRALDGQSALSRSAKFFETRNRFREAVDLYERVPDLADVSTTSILIARLGALGAAVSISDDPDRVIARHAWKALEDDVMKSRSRQLPPQQVELINDIERDAQRLKEKHKF